MSMRQKNTERPQMRPWNRVFTGTRRSIPMYLTLCSIYYDFEQRWTLVFDFSIHPWTSLYPQIRHLTRCAAVYLPQYEIRVFFLRRSQTILIRCSFFLSCFFCLFCKVFAVAQPDRGLITEVKRERLAGVLLPKCFHCCTHIQAAIQTLTQDRTSKAAVQTWRLPVSHL